MSPARFELTASELGILRSIQLSYEDIQVINQLNLTACQILLYKNTTCPNYEVAGSRLTKFKARTRIPAKFGLAVSFLDNLFADVLWNFLIVVKFHRISSATLRHRAKVSRVTKHLS